MGVSSAYGNQWWHTSQAPQKSSWQEVMKARVLMNGDADEWCGGGDRACKQQAGLEAEGTMTIGHWAISECHQTVSIFFLLQVSF